MKIIHEFKVDFARSRTEACIEVMQGDSLTRCVKIQLYCDGNPWEIPKETSPSVHWSRPDGESGSYELSSMDEQVLGDSYILATLPGEVTAVPGVAHVAVLLTNGQAKLNTWAAKVVVHPNPCPDGA